MFCRCTVACTNIEKIDKMVFEGKTKTRCGGTLQIADMHWPWGAGMFATSLGPDDACFVAGANWNKNSGLMCVWGQVCAVQKEFIEATKTLGLIWIAKSCRQTRHAQLLCSKPLKDLEKPMSTPTISFASPVWSLPRLIGAQGGLKSH